MQIINVKVVILFSVYESDKLLSLLLTTGSKKFFVT